MLTTIISLLGGGMGALVRLLPELMKMYTAKADQAHELRMTQLQLEIDKARATQQLDLAHVQQDGAEALAQMNALVEAVKVQGQMTGVKFIDALNQSVRPVTTYWWQVLFTLYKVQDIQQHGITWGENDWAMLSMILGFWYVDRAIRVKPR